MSKKICYRCRQEMNIIKLVKVYEHFMLQASSAYGINQEEFAEAMVGLTKGVNIFSARIGLDFIFPALTTGEGLANECKKVYLDCFTMNLSKDCKDKNIGLFKDFLNTYSPIIDKATKEKIEYEKSLREAMSKNTTKSVIKDIATISASAESAYQVNTFHLPKYCAVVSPVKTQKTSAKTKTKSDGKDR